MNENEVDVPTIEEPEETPVLEPDRNLNISGLQITLCNEMIQKINEQLVVTFTTKASLDDIVQAFKNNEKIEYDDQCYEGYQMIMALTSKIGNMGTLIHQITLELVPEPEPEPPVAELSEDQEFAIAYAVSCMSDGDAVEHKSLFMNYEDIEEGAEIQERVRLNYKDGLWKCNKTHKKNSATWFPGNDPTLFEQLDKDEHKGTQEDPIPVPESVTTSGFTYIYGKYYSWNDTVYICKRGGVPKPEDMYGQEVKLNYSPDALIGQYFEKV